MHSEWRSRTPVSVRIWLQRQTPTAACTVAGSTTHSSANKRPEISGVARRGMGKSVGGVCNGPACNRLLLLSG